MANIPSSVLLWRRIRSKWGYGRLKFGLPPGRVKDMVISRSGSLTGSSRNTMASKSEKIALVAPMPSASDATVNRANAGLRRSSRTP